MNWNTIQPDERVIKWRNLRDDLRHKSARDIISMVVDAISTTNFSNRTIDYYTPASWPAPWEILFNGLLCVNGVSLLAYHTLRLAGVSNVCIYLVEFAGDVFLVPVIDGVYVLNFTPGAVKNILALQQDDRFKIITVFSNNDIKQV